MAWVTSDYVLDETITRLFARRPFALAERFCDGVLRAGSIGTVQVERIDRRRFDAAYALRRKYRDKPRISFTDFTSFIVMQELGITHALTGDAHFQQVGLGFMTLP
jgi:predicted nucleic acid-binding protein